MRLGLLTSSLGREKKVVSKKAVCGHKSLGMSPSEAYRSGFLAQLRGDLDGRTRKNDECCDSGRKSRMHKALL